MKEIRLHNDNNFNIDYVIRRRTKDDCKSIAHIVTVSWNETYKGIVPDEELKALNENETQRAMNSYNDFDENDNNQFVLEIENSVVGFVNFGATDDKDFINCGEIFALYILPEYKGRGYGKRLVEEAKKELKRLGFDKMIISCLKGNPSNDFYKHIGGAYIKDGKYKRLNLDENVYLYENI